MIKLIHPKTGTVREVAEQNQNKLNILKRAGFVLFDTYKAPKKLAVVPDPSLAEVVEGEKADPLEALGISAPEVAIHVSPAASKLIEKKGLDPTLIKGTGKDGAIIKKDVQKFLKATKAESEPNPEPEPEEEAATDEAEAEAEKAQEEFDAEVHEVGGSEESPEDPDPPAGPTGEEGEESE